MDVQRSVFPGLTLRAPQSPIVLLIFSSGRIVCTGYVYGYSVCCLRAKLTIGYRGKSYSDIQKGFNTIYQTLKSFVHTAVPAETDAADSMVTSGGRRKRRRCPQHA